MKEGKCMESNKKNLDAYYRIGLSEEEKEKYYDICENTEIKYEPISTSNKTNRFERLTKTVVASIAIMATVVLAGYGVMHFRGNESRNGNKNVSECESINNEMIKKLDVPEGYGIYTIKVIRTNITQKYQEKRGEEVLSVGDTVDIDLIDESIDKMIFKTYKDISYTSLKGLKILAISDLETKNKEKYDRNFITKTLYPNPDDENELESNVENESKSDDESKRESYEFLKERRYEIYSSCRRDHISNMMDRTEEEFPQNKDKQIDVYGNGYEYITLQLKNEDLKKMKENVEKYGEVEYYDYDLLKFDDLENFEEHEDFGDRFYAPSGIHIETGHHTYSLNHKHVVFQVDVLEDDVKNFENLKEGGIKTLVFKNKKYNYKKEFKDKTILNIFATEKDHKFYYQILFDVHEDDSDEFWRDNILISDKDGYMYIK